MGSCICAVFEYSNLYIYLYFLSLAMVKSDQPNIREEVRKRSVWDRVWTAVVVNWNEVLDKGEESSFGLGRAA